MSAATPQSGPRSASAPQASHIGPFTPIDPIRLLKQYRNSLIVVAIVSVIVGIATTYILGRLIPRYDAVITLSVVKQATRAEQQTINAGASGSKDDLQTDLRTQAILITSDDIYDRVLHRADVQRTDWYLSHNVKNSAGQTTFDVDAAMGDLRKNVDAAQIKGASLLKVTVGARFPRDAAIIANTVADVFIEKTMAESVTNIAKLLDIFSSARNKTQQDITELDRRRKALMDDSQLSAVESRQSEVSQKFQTLLTNQQLAQTNLFAFRNLHESLVKAKADNTFQYTAEELLAADENPFIKTRDERILQLKEERRVNAERFGPKHRAVTDLDLRIQATEVEKQQKREELLRQVQDVRLSQTASQVASAEAAFNQLSTQLDEARRQLKDLNEKMTEFVSLKDEIKRKTDILQDQDKQIASIKLMSARPDIISVQKEGAAETPQSRAFPRYELFVPGFMFGALFLVVGFLFVREMLDQRLKGPACCKLLPATDVLGVIPDAAEDRSAKGLIDLVVARHPHGLLAEAFRQSRSEILDRMQRRGYRTLMFVGAQGGSGVTSVSTNLATTAAYNNRRVILIDANFRRPSLHRVFGIPADQPGLADLLSGTADLDQSIQHSPVPGLDIMSIGNARSGTIEQLESAALRSALTELESRYDLIMIDAPPLSIVGDSRQLANRADAVVLVARAMHDKRGLVSRLLNQLHGATAECLGIVLNGVRASRGGYFSKNYRAFYDYHSGTHQEHAAPSQPAPQTRGKTPAADAPTGRIAGSPANLPASSDKP